MIPQTTFCGGIIATGIATGVEDFHFSADQVQLLSRFDDHFSERGPNALEALRRFLPPNAV